jgi:ATP-dependent helicase HrpB
LLVTLHGDLSPAEQDRAVKPADRRKVILSTNVAETSVTIDGVVAVIDSGLARIAAHAPWSGLPTLRVGRISRASAIQRAGRAGRTRPGRCVRLFTKHDFDTRPDHDAPEIARLDLAETVLELKCTGVDDLASFAWFEPPPTTALTAASTLLTRLGALDSHGRATDTGRAMLRFPVHPRQARMILESERRGVAEDGCILAALVGEREIRTASRSHGMGPRTASRRDERGDSDLLFALEAFDDAERSGFSHEALRHEGLEPASVLAVDRVRKQLERAADKRTKSPAADSRESELLKVILAGYPDRVGRRRRPANATGRVGDEIVFATGGTAMLADTSAVRDAELLVAIDAEERTEASGRSRTMVRVASAVESDWLLEMFTDAIVDSAVVSFNSQTERVEFVRRLAYEGLALEETAARPTQADTDAIARVLADAALARGIRAFVDADAFDRLSSRVAFLREQRTDLDLPALDDAMLRTALTDAANAGALTFADLRNAGLLDVLRSHYTPAQQRALDEFAPDRIELPGGRRARVEYPAGAAPFLESRLQDFFGMAVGPSVAGGRVPVVLHLLAPNQRAVQVTTDLAGFWTKHYPSIAKELRRKYPKHSWPDDPRNAQPPPFQSRRRT